MLDRVKKFFNIRGTGYNAKIWSVLDNMGQTASASGQRVSEQTALEVIFAMVRVISESIGTCALELHQSNPDGGKTKAKGHWLYNLIQQPNYLMDSQTFRECAVSHLCIRGNAYLKKEYDTAGRVIALWPLNPGNMRIEIKSGRVIYIYNKGDKEIIYNTDDLIHIKILSPDGIQGYSPLSVLRNQIGTNLGQNEYVGSLYKQAASPAAVLEVSPDNPLSEQEYKRLQKEFAKRHEGSKKAGKTLLLESGLTYKQIGLSPMDQQLIESQKFSFITLSRLYRVPLHLLNFLDFATYSNISTQQAFFAQNCLLPYFLKIEAAFDSLLSPQDKNIFFSEHNLSHFLRGNQIERIQSYKAGRQFGYLSINDVRRLERLGNPVEGGDVYGMPQQPQQQVKSIGAVQTRAKPESLIDKHIPLIQEVAQSLIVYEVEQVRKIIGTRDNTDIAAKIEKFYGGFSDEVRSRLSAAISNLSVEAKQAAETIMGGKSAGDMSKWVSEHVGFIAKAWIGSSSGQLLKHLKDEKDLNEKLDGWIEKRAKTFSTMQAAKTANRMNLEAADRVPGYRVVNRGGTCKWCVQLNGKTLSVTKPALPAGEWNSPAGSMLIRRPAKSPIWHKSCGCRAEIEPI